MPSCQTGAALSSGHGNAGTNNATRLLEMLRLVKDFRKARGKMYQLDYVLAVAVVATLAGGTDYTRIGREAKDMSQHLLAQLGGRYDHFQGRYVAPSESTIREVLKNVDGDALDIVVGTWLQERAARQDDGDLVIALDGKVLRGAWTNENRQVTLFSAMIHNQGVVIAQVRVPDGTNEITQVDNLLKNVKYKRGRTIVTVDAAHTQFKTAISLRKRGIDYVMNVKMNQPKLFKTLFATCIVLMQETDGHMVEERSHGRIKRWTVWTTSAEGIRFPFARTIAVIRRDEFDLDGTPLTKEFAYVITSLHKDRAAPAAIHTYVRQHWGIENRVHYVRDTTWREDACQTHVGNGPRNLAILRNLALSLLRLHGVNKIKEAVEAIGRDRDRALAYLAT
jgi:predicted transposase YbfD/YdcC